jgi:hypothetical protein
MYEEHAVSCVRLAETANEAIISFGLIKMAQAWLDLADSKSRADPAQKGAPRSSSEHTTSRRLNRAARAAAGGAVSRSKGSGKTAEKRRIRS